MSAPSPRSGDDPDALAAQAIASDLSVEKRQEVFLRLRPFIERQVRRLCVRFSGQTRQDLIDDAVAIVWEAMPLFTAGRRFEPWCRSVLKNSAIDHLRRTSRSAALDPHQAAEVIEDWVCRRALEDSLQRSEPLPAADIERMDGWPPRDRIVLGCLSGVWRKVPSPRWTRWVDECRQEYGYPAPGGFPPDAFENSDNANDRTAALADLLGQRLNTIRVWIHRGRQRLRELTYVSDRIGVREDDR
jgi:DNA-directed RNA polymerase specialized sigma24 family protein